MPPITTTHARPEKTLSLERMTEVLMADIYIYNYHLFNCVYQYVNMYIYIYSQNTFRLWSSICGNPTNHTGSIMEEFPTVYHVV